MKYAVISDTHANLEALTVCLRKIDEIKPDRIICLGDLIDYCAQPNECTELIKNNCDVVILGNHDEAQFRYSLAGGFSKNAFISSLHTRDIIKNEYIEYFLSLPYTHSENNLLFVHASPYKPEMYEYCDTLEIAELNFKHFKEAVCFVGHSHIPVVFEKSNRRLRTVQENKITLENKYIKSGKCRAAERRESKTQLRNIRFGRIYL